VSRDLLGKNTDVSTILFIRTRVSPHRLQKRIYVVNAVSDAASTVSRYSALLVLPCSARFGVIRPAKGISDAAHKVGLLEGYRGIIPPFSDQVVPNPLLSLGLKLAVHSCLSRPAHKACLGEHRFQSNIGV